MCVPHGPNAVINEHVVPFAALTFVRGYRVPRFNQDDLLVEVLYHGVLGVAEPTTALRFYVSPSALMHGEDVPIGYLLVPEI